MHGTDLHTACWSGICVTACSGTAIAAGSTQGGQTSENRRVFLRRSKNADILRNPTFHCHVLRSSKTVPILSQINPVRAPTKCLFKVHFDIIIPFMFRSSKWSLFSFHVLQSNPYMNFASLPCTPHTCPFHTLYLTTEILFRYG